MNCDRGCGLDDVVHVTAIADGVETAVHLCLRCARGEAGCEADATLTEVLQKLVLRQSGQ